MSLKQPTPGQQDPATGAAPQTIEKPRFSIFKVLLPVAIGLGVVVWLFHREYSPEVWKSIHFDARVILFIMLAWVFMGGRDLGMSWRFRALTNRKLTWGQSWKVCMLCEFTSCVTPSAVGGSSLGMVFLHTEGIELGRATTLMITTLFLDELFFVVSLPIIMLLVPYQELFGFSTTFTTGLKGVFWAIYSLVFIWTSLLFVGILVKPLAVRNFLVFIFKFKPLRRWQPAVQALGENMVATSHELKQHSWRWWGECFLGTALSWSSRYLVVNALFLGFAPMADQVIVFARQFVIWIVLMISPTPGGSGVSEWLFTEYYGDMISGEIALVIALFWRIISYYVYLVIGAFLVPSWIRKTFGRKQSITGSH